MEACHISGSLPKPVAKKKKQLAFAENMTGAVFAKTKMGSFTNPAFAAATPETSRT